MFISVGIPGCDTRFSLHSVTGLTNWYIEGGFLRSLFGWGNSLSCFSPCDYGIILDFRLTAWPSPLDPPVGRPIHLSGWSRHPRDMAPSVHVSFWPGEPRAIPGNSVPYTTPSTGSRSGASPWIRQSPRVTTSIPTAIIV